MLSLARPIVCPVTVVKLCECVCVCMRFLVRMCKTHMQISAARDTQYVRCLSSVSLFVNRCEYVGKRGFDMLLCAPKRLIYSQSAAREMRHRRMRREDDLPRASIRNGCLELYRRI